MARRPLPFDRFAESGGEDRWLVSYADFVTLLFAFFVVMYAVARSNNVELVELSRTLSGLQPQIDVVNGRRHMRDPRQSPAEFRPFIGLSLRIFS
jgi:flagellar motor protein MotB